MGVWCGWWKVSSAVMTHLLSWRILNGGGCVSGLQTVCVSCVQSGRVQPVVLPVAEWGKRYHDEICACISAVEQTCGGPGRGQEEVCPPPPPQGGRDCQSGSAKCVCVLLCGWVGVCMGSHRNSLRPLVYFVIFNHPLITCTESTVYA